MRAAARAAAVLGRPMRSIGVDSWGVDYGLVDAERPPPRRSRSATATTRTAGAMERRFARVPRAEIFARTGIQFLPINTLFQLVAHARDRASRRGAARLLLIPDLVTIALTRPRGHRVHERDDDAAA